MSRSPLTALFAIATFALMSGCASDHGFDRSPMPAEDLCENGCDTDAQMVRIFGSVHDADTGWPVSAVTVCSLLDSERDCIRTDLEGRFDMTVRPGSIYGAASDELVAFTLKRPGCMPMVHSFQAGEASAIMWDLAMLSEEDLADQADRVRDSIANGNGNVLVRAEGALRANHQASPVEGLQVRTDGQTYYTDDDGNLDIRRSGMSSDATAMVLNVGAGLQTVASYNPDHDMGCLPMSGWAGTRPGTSEVFVLPGHVSVTSFSCR
ncbi:MAG: hypothetical protein GY898_16685 [Proteobacteria bacterium]|nr:hypothetical protein [Pseudomonadota bacterium]